MKYFLPILNLLLFTSCATYYQVAELRSANISIKDDHLQFDNDSVRITYNFWSNRGLVWFNLYNKTDKPIYIDWKKSSVIIKDFKVDYWIDKVESQSTTLTSYYYNWYNKSSVAVSSGSAVKDERITFVPPHAAIIKASIVIMPTGKFVINNNTPKDGIKSDTIPYEKSKFKIRNFITYSFSEDGVNPYYLDNEFYVSATHEMKTNKFEVYHAGSIPYTYPFAKPTRFYLKLE